MLTFYRCFFVCFSLFAAALALLHPAPSHAEPASPALVVIRFNQANVYYDQQLYNAIAQALKVKPQVTFSVVSFAPATGDSAKDAEWIRTASRNTQGVVATLRAMGVPQERLRITGQASSAVAFDETRIYAQ
jgi:hypothetical protein